MKAEPDKPVAAVERALLILDAFRKGDGALTLTEVSARTGLYMSTILRLAKTLEDFGYLAKNRDGALCLGPKPLHLGRLFQDSLQPSEIILPVLRDLVAATGESAAYSVRFGDHRVCALRVDTSHVIRPHVVPGESFPLTSGCGGRMFLAFEQPLRPEYEPVRRKLVASSAGELGPDMAGVAAPVFDAGGGLAGVLTVSGPHTRFNLAAMRRCERVLIEAARRATAKLGGEAMVFDGVLQLPRPGMHGKIAEPLSVQPLARITPEARKLPAHRRRPAVRRRVSAR